jgi:pimeloyl-ACP methyl ester carboxylesterase
MTLAHSDHGSGPAIVLLHAFPLNREMWRDVVDPISAAGWRVITPDLPGFGASTPTVATIDEMADAVAALLDECGVHSAVIGGCSMGGYVGLAFAQRYPGRVAGLLLVDTKASADSDDARANRERIAQQVIDSGSPRALASTMPDTLLGSSTRRDNPALVDWVQQRILAAPVAGIAAAQRAMAGRREQFDTLASLRVPTLSIRGVEDGTATAADHAAMAAAALDVVDVEVPNAGHLLPIEQPSAFLAHVLPFLERVRGPHC